MAREIPGRVYVSTIYSNDGEDLQSILNRLSSELDDFMFLQQMIEGSITEITKNDLKSVTKLGNGTMYGNQNLTSVELQDNITEIGQNAFQGCSNITNLVLPENLQTIQYGAFTGCQGLTTVVFPENVKTLVTSFNSCSNLKTLVFKGTTPPAVGVGIFGGSSPDLKIMVPAEAVDTYKSATTWSSLASKVVPIE